MSYHELQGFLFAVAAAPDLVMPSEWLPMIFGGDAPAFDNEQQAEAMTQDIMAVYNDVTARVRSDRATLPDDCAFRDALMSNFDLDAPISQWSRGFSQGHQWLLESWDPYVPDDVSDELGLQLMTLGFFATPRIAAAFARELKRTDVEALAEIFRDAFPHVIADYARFGRVIEQVLNTDPGPTPVRREGPKVGRNALCPCGSGRKYKKCCGGN